MATVLVTKPFIHAGFIRRDKETVKFWMLYQALTKVGAGGGKENGKACSCSSRRQEAHEYSWLSPLRRSWRRGGSYYPCWPSVSGARPLDCKVREAVKRFMSVQLLSPFVRFRHF